MLEINAQNNNDNDIDVRNHRSPSSKPPASDSVHPLNRLTIPGEVGGGRGPRTTRVGLGGETAFVPRTLATLEYLATRG